tara:strand:+ start:4639 stop:5916 length:1278 start_codon:yes stop_codon:yes gene_type:complete
MADHGAKVRMKLKDVCRLITDGKHGDCESQADSGYYFLSCKDVRDGKLNYVGARQITEADFHDTHRRTQLEPNDILITNSGTIGRMAIAPKADRTHQTTFQKSVAIVKPDHAKVLSRWLYYYLLAEVERLIAFAGGTAQKNLLLRDMRAFEIEVPRKSTQRRIASILSAYDDLIENNTRRIAILEEMARRLYEEWFVHFRFPGHEDATFIEIEDGKIPKDWRLKSIGEMTSHVRYGYTARAQSKAEGPKFLRITDIVPNEISWESVPYCEISEKNLDKYMLEEGDIVVARTGATTGYAKRLNKKFPRSVFASYLVRMRFPNQILSRYFGMIMESENYKQFIHQHMSGAAQPNANAQVLTSMRAIVPTDELLEEFDKKIKPITDAKEVLQLKSANARSQRDLLLPKLISGEIDVSKAEERIGGEAA